MSIKSHNSLGCLAELVTGKSKYKYFDLNIAAKKIGLDLTRLPYTHRVLLENVLRLDDGSSITKDTFNIFTRWLENKKSTEVIPFMPSRVLMQDFTGVPAIVDLAAMRDAMKNLGGDVSKINPLIPVDLVIDHSVQTDHYGSKNSLKQNTELEMERNRERYEFLKWGQQTFQNFKVVPPGTGICHQVNLEYLAQVVWVNEENGEKFAYPDSLVGTDSHTTMVNGLAVLGWGVGGIEAEAAMLGQALPMILPEVIGFKINGKYKSGITATDIVLTITQKLRKHGVVGKFVEFFGNGLDCLSLADRATIANMAPEYGATCGFFAVDNKTIEYLELTARDPERILLVKEYSKKQQLFRNPSDKIEYTEILELDLANVEPSLAGPKRPQDRIDLKDVASSFERDLPSFTDHDANFEKSWKVNSDYEMKQGHVVIAAITSCTNTSNPSVMISAGLVAKKANMLGLKSKPWVKTSLAPGSKVVKEYLDENGLSKHLDAIGFNVTGYGCTTCIGNSGPLKQEIEDTITANDLTVASVLSGNRNFEGRVHPLVKANYLASPPLVVAYALAGNIHIDITREPVGFTSNGSKVFLKDIWPSNEEIAECISSSITPEMFASKYSDVFAGDEHWQAINVPKSDTYSWNPESTYVNNPPYFIGMSDHASKIKDIHSATILAMLGDSITTDHISPAGNIAANTPAAKYLEDNKIDSKDFNSYGSRRGNHEVMMRGTFANIRIKNELVPGVEGGITKYIPTGEEMSIYDASMKYQKKNMSLVVIAGKEYGTGSSRDWAAKGAKLLGVNAVIAESFERIHRSNLVGMGVLPLIFEEGMNRKSLNLDGSEKFDILGLEGLTPLCKVKCVIHRPSGVKEKINLIARVDTESEVEYLKHGGILHKVLRELK